MIRNTCGKFQSNISNGYLENKPLHANFNLRCEADTDADAGGSTIALLILIYSRANKKCKNSKLWLLNMTH